MAFRISTILVKIKTLINFFFIFIVLSIFKRFVKPNQSLNGSW